MVQKTLKTRTVYELPSSGECADIHLNIPAGAQVVLLDEGILHGARERNIELELGPNSGVKWLSVQNQAKNTKWSDSKTVRLGENSEFNYFHNILGGSESEDSLKVFLEGESSRALTQTLFFAGYEQRQSITVEHIHSGKNTQSTLISKGAVKDKARDFFNGTLRILPGSSGAVGDLIEHNLLLSPNARIEAIPALEISHHEVQASHSATMERVDEDKLFYLCSRGLTQEAAFKLMVEGFFWEALEKMGDERLSKLIFKELMTCLQSI